MGLLNIGLSGILTAQKNLSTTSHNISNVGTDGYSRQGNIQVANYPFSSGGGYFGSGSSVVNVVRYYSAHLETQLRDSNTRTHDLNAYYQTVRQVDNLLASDDAGLSAMMNSFFSSMDAVSKNPNDISIRQQFLTVAGTLTSRILSMDARLDEINEGINMETIATVEQINNYAQNISKLNEQIQQLRGRGQEPNDLLDQREYQITKLSELINVQVFENAVGGLNVFIGTGQPLVMGDQILSLGTRLSKMTSAVEIVTFDNSVGEVELPESVLTGGKLGGLMASRREGVDVAKNNLGAIVMGLLQTFNAQHQLGMDLEGKNGKPFFQDIQPVVNPNGKNTGTAGVTAAFTTPSQLLAASANIPYTLEKTANGYQLLDNTNTPIDNFSALPHEYNGFVIQLNGPLETGDKFSLSDAGVVPFPTNRGGGNVTLNVSNVRPSDYLLTKTATGYTLLRQSDNTYIPIPAGFPATESIIVDGLKIDLTGVADKGDMYLIRPTHDVADMLQVNLNDPRELAVGLPFRTAAETTNTGTASISAGKVNVFPPLDVNAPNIRDRIEIEFTDTTSVPMQFTIDGAGPFNYLSGSPISVKGITFEISGTPRLGDKFVISENQAGVADNRNALELFGLQSQKIINGGSDSYIGVYKSLVSDVGMKTNLAYNLGTAEATILEQRLDDKDALSGVNPEEEGVNLMRYNEAYRAASKVLEVASNLFDNILQAVR